MRIGNTNRARGVLLVLSVALLAGCTSVGDKDAKSGAAGGGGGTPSRGGTVTVAVAKGWDAYNSASGTGAGPQNYLVDNLVQSGFWKYGSDGAVVRNEEFGTFQKVSDSPLTVEYTINEAAVWSDGTPIDYDDFLLNWAVRSGLFTTGEKDPVTGGDAMLFTAVSDRANSYQQMPEGEPGARTFKLVYSQPSADWETAVQNLLPAHVAAKQGGLTSEKLVEAIKRKDIAALGPVAKFWNTGWQYTVNSPVPDPALVPSSGPYRLSKRENSSLVLERNTAYWGKPANLDTIVLRTLDGNEQAQALMNGEVDVISPEPQIDIYQKLTKADGVTVLTGDNYAFTHLDFNTKSAVFSDLRVRQAFAKCVPRQKIVDTLVKPINPKAQVMDLHEYFPFQPDYDAVRKLAPAADGYRSVDVAGAKQLLAESGTSSRKVRILTSAGDKRFADAIALITTSCKAAGFDVAIDADKDWGDKVTGDAWDAVLFPWHGTGLVAGSDVMYVTDGVLNFGHFSSPEVDAAWDQLATETDPAKVKALKGGLEQKLWTDMFNVPLYAQPGITAVSDRVRGVIHNSSASGVTFNAAEWSVAGR